MRGTGRALCIPSAPVAVAPLRFLDIETSGLRADRGGRITEMAVLSQEKVHVNWTYSLDAPVGSESHDEAVHSVLTRLLLEFEESVVVAHNAPFDLQFIAYECRRLGIEGLTVQMIDTLALARGVCADIADHRLETLADVFKLSVSGPMHTALVDAQVTRDLFEVLVQKGALETLDDAGLRRLSWG